MQYTEEQITNLRKIEMDILDYVVNICQENNLKYSIAYGTLIGAIRHEGFIPWDDDIDILMPRADYDKLKSIWEVNGDCTYYIHDYYTDPNCTNNFLKIRKSNTTFYGAKGFDDPNMSGIFIDVFPADRVPNCKLGRIIQYGAAAINMLFSRQYPSGKKGIFGFIERILLKIPRSIQIIFRNESERIVKRWNKKDTGLLVCASTIKEAKIYYPGTMFDKLVDVKFADKYYKATAEYNACLTAMYGDYMKLPPKSKQVYGHAPKILDFERGYKDIVK